MKGYFLPSPLIDIIVVFVFTFTAYTAVLSLMELITVDDDCASHLRQPVLRRELSYASKVFLHCYCVRQKLIVRGIVCADITKKRTDDLVAYYMSLMKRTKFV
jgi:hypothetical protein